ncbi:heat shock protein 67B1-like [Pectinophora gossypiella]|nr:heat shock protein 67B1-like [Pectinophora gossypiella]
MVYRFESDHKRTKMIKALLLLTLAGVCLSEKQVKQQYVDPFAALDKHISHTLAYHYLWPWSQLMKAAAVLDEDAFDEPQIVSDTEKLEVNMNVKRFKPDELRVKVKNRNIIVEGKHKLDGDNRFMANHFVQRFVLPPGSKQEEVTAVLKENGILTVSVPRHEVPPPPPERVVPIEVKLPVKEKEEQPEKKTEKPKKPTEVTKAPELAKEPEKVTEVTEKKEESVATTSATPLEQLELVEATTHVGKIRKKELKESSKTVKDNEVTKGVDGNGLDYALIESE